MDRKRVRIDTDFQPKKKKIMLNSIGNRSFVGNDDDDRISQLSDDVLIGILSLLSMKEAARTSVLSSRWINLWKHTPSLDFDAQSAPPRHEYVKWVDTILQSHKSPTLKLFRIHYGLDATSISDSITRWLEFAFSRQVEMLDFNIYFYCFPEELFAPRNSVPLDFKSLKSLSLKNVKVSGGAIEFFLRNCPLLEQLTVANSPAKISKLEVCGSSLLLKHLEIVHCSGLESLKISAPSLASLRVTSLWGLMLENVPMLVDVCVSFEVVSLKRVLSVLCCCISQLVTLELVLRSGRVSQQIDELSNFPEMPKLKKLVVEYGAGEDECFIGLAFLTRVAPYLEEFVLKNDSLERTRVEDAAAFVRFRHNHLKVFKFSGYSCGPCDDALVAYILENCVVLEKIVITPYTYIAFSLSRLDRLRAHEAARKNAKKHLQPQMPRHVELVIL